MSDGGEQDGVCNAEATGAGRCTSGDSRFQIDLLQEQLRLLNHTVSEHSLKLEALSQTVQENAVSVGKGMASAAIMDVTFGEFCHETRERLTVLDRNLTEEVRKTPAVTQTSIERLVACEVRGLEGQYKTLEDSVKEELRNLRESVREELRFLRVYVLQGGPACKKTYPEQSCKYIAKMLELLEDLEDEKDVGEDCGRKLEEAARNAANICPIHTKVADADVLRCREEVGREGLGLSSIKTAPKGLWGVGAHCMEKAGCSKKSTTSFVETTMPAAVAYRTKTGCVGEIEDEINVGLVTPRLPTRAPTTPRRSASCKSTAIDGPVFEVVFTPNRTQRADATGVNPPLQQTQQQQQVLPQQQPQLQQLQQTQQPRRQRSASPPMKSYSMQYPKVRSKGLSASYVLPVKRLTSPTPSYVMSPQLVSPRPVLVASEAMLHPGCVSGFQTQSSQILRRGDAGLHSGVGHSACYHLTNR